MSTSPVDASTAFSAALASRAARGRGAPLSAADDLAAQRRSFSRAPAPEAAWSARGAMLIDVIPCLVRAGYFREVGALVGLCRATWRDKSTWGALGRATYGDDARTRLHWACAKGKAERARELLDECASDIEARDKLGDTPLLAACWRGSRDVVRLLLDRGAAIDARSNNKRGALYVAALKGHLDVVEELLDRGAAHAATNNGRTPLLAASERGHLAVAKLLLGRGAAVDASSAVTGHRTALALAVDGGHAAVAALLRAHGATL